ncbi:MAG: TonB-dependent receptor [Bacteroidales bacterium]|nr:TonB-dependent receptor [Bacteroidales bacterium]
MILNTLIIGAMLTIPAGSDTLISPSRVTALKESLPLSMIPAPVSRITSEEIGRSGIYRQDRLSSRIPGLLIPQYGASLTSTIYIRGLGSRMENPVMGLYIDGIPVLDKNAYDIDWTAVRSATLLRGPQGTLYGRNTMGGVLALRTLSPTDRGGKQAYLEYGTANSVRAGGAVIFGKNALSASLRHSDGFFRNEYKGKACDPYNGATLRWKWERSDDGRPFLSNTLSVAASKEGGFAYGKLDGEDLGPVSYDGESGYSRLSIIEGMRARFAGEKIVFDLAGSVQALMDDMRMDQDYTPRSVFTLRQKQKNGTATFEALARKADETGRWSPLSGAFLFGRYNGMSAPVSFLRDGIESLILDNANKNIPSQIGFLQISDNELPVASDFRIASWGAALFHESSFTFGKWRLSAGVRLDYEGAVMDYDCLASLHYRFNPTMASEKAFSIPYNGSLGHSRFQVLPKFSVMCNASEGLFIYANATKGSRAGGFNTQIFSDILQNLMMNGLMNDLGVHFDKPSVSVGADNTRYDPEVAWNYEFGARYSKGGFRSEVSVYQVNVKDQQLTVFPPGMSIGRMMTNAGKSRSRGVETEIGWRGERFHTSLTYSFCDARFLEYNDGNNDYSGNRVPYVPEHTLYVGAGLSLPVGENFLEMDTALKGTGPIAWNETGSRSEPWHMTLEGRISFKMTKYDLYLEGTNLTGTRAGAFYFKSVGNEFLALSRPRSIIAGIIIYF